MRKLLLVFLSLVLILGILAPAALAKDDGSAGGSGSGGFGNGGGGGGGYVQRKSGIWVPEYIQRNAKPTFSERVKELSMGAAKEIGTKGAATAGGALATYAAASVKNVVSDPRTRSAFLQMFSGPIIFRSR